VLVDINSNGTNFASVAQTDNQMNVASALDTVKTNAPADVMQTINAITLLSADQARTAYTQLSGDALAYFQNADLQSAGLFTRQMNERARPTEFAVASADSAAPIQVAYNGEIEDLGPLNTAASTSNGLWARGVGLVDHTDADASIGSPSSRSRTGGVQGGYDHTAGEHGLLGIAAGYAKTTLDVDARLSSGNSIARQVGLYTRYSPSAWFFNGSLGFTTAGNDMTRGINFSGSTAQAHSDFKSRTYTGFAETGYTFKPQDRLSLEPSVSVEGNHVDEDAFTETGAPGFNLSVGNRKLDSVVSSVGGRLARTFLPDTAHPFLLGIRGAWEHEFRDINNLISARFAEAPAASFTVQGTPQKRNAAAVGAEFRLALYKELQAFADYTARLSTGKTDQGLLGGLSFKW